MERDPEFLNEQEAARLWQRAAELQAAEPRPIEGAVAARARGGFGATRVGGGEAPLAKQP